MIKSIAFDYGGVIKIYKSNLIQDISDYLNINKSDWEKEYFSLNYLINIKQKTFEDVMIMVLNKFTNLEESKKYLLELIKNSNQYYINEEVIKIIKHLKNLGYNISLLSNNTSEIRLEMTKDNIIDLFDNIIISSEVGFQKPDPEIFKILFNNLNLNPNEVVFVDDTWKSLENNEQIGYVPVFFENNEKLKLDLYRILNISI